MSLFHILRASLIRSLPPQTFLQTGPNNPSADDLGVNFRALNDLFAISQNRKEFMSYEVGVQMMEIYNEQVRDLLCSDGSNKRYPMHGFMFG